MKKGTIHDESGKIVGFYEMLPNGNYYVQLIGGKKTVNENTFKQFLTIMEYDVVEDDGLIIE